MHSGLLLIDDRNGKGEAKDILVQVALHMKLGWNGGEWVKGFYVQLSFVSQLGTLCDRALNVIAITRVAIEAYPWNPNRPQQTLNIGY